MTLEEQLSIIELDIKKMSMDIDKVKTYLEKMLNARHEDAVKLSMAESNLNFLKEKNINVSLAEYSKINNSKKHFIDNIALSDIEIQKLREALNVHGAELQKLITKKNNILNLLRKGVVIPFPRKTT